MYIAFNIGCSNTCIFYTQVLKKIQYDITLCIHNYMNSVRMALTNQDLPVLVCVRRFVCSTHLGEGHAANDEDDQTGASLVVRRTTILVPLAITSTESDKVRYKLIC